MPVDLPSNERPAEDADVDWLLALRLETMTPHLDASGANLSLQDQLNRVLQDFALIRIVTLRGSDVGMFKLDRSSDPWALIQIQVKSALQGRGIGTQLVRQLQNQAGAHGIALELSVLKVNPAKALYDRLGFTVVGESEHSYAMCYCAEQRK